MVSALLFSRFHWVPGRVLLSGFTDWNSVDSLMLRVVRSHSFGAMQQGTGWRGKSRVVVSLSLCPGISCWILRLACCSIL